MANEFSADPLPAEGDILDQAGHLVARLAHDLRSPLHLVAGYADLLNRESNGPLTAKQKHFVESIRSGAKAIEKEIESSQERLGALLKSGAKR
jgi:signal transduction histidine kinase